jgi:hypothetical protein
MAEETQEQETVQETVQVEAPAAEEKQETPAATEIADDGTIKVDLRNFKEKTTDAVQEQSTDEVPVRDESGTSEGVQEENVEATNEQTSGEGAADDSEDQVLELIQEEVVEPKGLSDKIKDIPNKLKEDTESVNNNQDVRELPENIDKLVKFMEETGGTVEDYVKLNKDYGSMEEMDLLREHYRQSKPHLSEDEISFLIEDTFSYDEDVEEERDIKRKKLALKESIAEAKSSLNSLKSKYYDELKLSSKLTPEQREAVQFYNDYKKDQESSTQLAQKQRSIFEQKTNQLFTEEFKGFDFKVGENKYRFKVKDVNKVKESQADINTLVSKFVNDNNEMEDARGYHKALFTAMNADAIANHFYEQGKADALKNQIAKSKNIDMAPRSSHEKVTTNSGFQVKAISGEDSGRLKIKLRQ